ncbi:hypothetical protein C3476_28775 [Mycobacterium kansasii]|nr:hypothetical protein C3476_28775 [Mycobacterium kansasii]
MPVVNDWLNDCGDSGAVAAAGDAGAETPGTDGPPIAGTPGGGEGVTVLGVCGTPGTWPGPSGGTIGESGGSLTRAGTWPAPCTGAFGDNRGSLTSAGAGAGVAGTWAAPCIGGSCRESKSWVVSGREGGGPSRFTPWSRSHVRASPPMVASSTRCVASIMFDMAFAAACAALAFFSAMTEFIAAILATVDSLLDKIRSISSLPE